MGGLRLEGNTAGNFVEVTEDNQLKTITETNVGTNPNNVGAVRIFHENDAGDILGTPNLKSPEVDDDFRTRFALDYLLDSETFNYTAQNTGKHQYNNSVLTITYNTSGLRTNGGGALTNNSGVTFGTYAEFPIFGGQALYLEFNASFDAQPATNIIIDFGMFRRGLANIYTPGDGIYFRLNASGLQGVINYNGLETTTSVFNFIYNNNQKYKFIITFNERNVQFWIDDILYGELTTPIGQGQPCLSATLPISIRHAHSTNGVAGAVLSMYINNYALHAGGYIINKTFGETQNALLGSYQGVSGGTMGQLITGTVTTGTLVKPTAAVPINNGLTGNLGNNLGGRTWEQLTGGLALNTDGVLVGYINPAAALTGIQGKRLRITGLKMSAVIQTVIVGGPVTNEFYIIFGGSTSLIVGESTTTRAARRILIPEFTQIITAAQAVNTPVSQISHYADFSSAPIYIDPGAVVGLVVNRFGTALTGGVIAYNYQFIYSWE